MIFFFVYILPLLQPGAGDLLIKVNNRTGREVTVAEPTLHPLAEKCCPSLLISSPGLALQEQGQKLGLYKSVGWMNSRRVYRQEVDLDPHYLYYHSWRLGKGANWMVGRKPGETERGIESLDLEARALDAAWCPEALNKAGYPWKVFTARGAWVGDTMLRLECGREEEKCCEVILVTSQGPAQDYQASYMGVYVGEAGYKGRLLFTHTERRQYIYYHDWGPNQGANWFFSSEVGSENRGLESVNVEYGYTNHSSHCIERGGGEAWRVWRGNNLGWGSDPTIKIQCL